MSVVWVCVHVGTCVCLCMGVHACTSVSVLPSLFVTKAKALGHKIKIYLFIY